MVRRLILGSVIGVALLAGPVAAQQSPPSTTTTETVLPTTILNSTTTTVAATTTETVAGVVIARPLPRTGGDIGPEVALGAGLTAAGLALAISARLRRQRVNAHAPG
jgi:hypothetical protein